MRRGASLAPGMCALADHHPRHRRDDPRLALREAGPAAPTSPPSAFTLLCYLDETGEAPAGILRRGNAGPNTAEHHFALPCDAFAQAASRALEELEILVRCAIGDVTHAFTQDCRYRLAYCQQARGPLAVTSLGADERLWRE